MNDNFGRGRSPRRSRLRWAGVLACAVLLAAACGSPTPDSAGSSAYAKALPFAQCMRSHGIGNFPDPDSSGNFDVGNSVSHSPQYATAQATCVRLHPYNMVLSPNQVAQLMAQALKFSRCMRAHGVLNFPDPTEGGSGISFGGQTSAGSGASSGQGSGGSGKPGGGTSHGSGSGVPSESPQYQAASHACQRYAGKGKS